MSQVVQMLFSCSSQIPQCPTSMVTNCKSKWAGGYQSTIIGNVEKHITLKVMVQHLWLSIGLELNIVMHLTSCIGNNMYVVDSDNSSGDRSNPWKL